jgi:hypothetical protein
MVSMFADMVAGLANHAGPVFVWRHPAHEAGWTRLMMVQLIDV